ncbi:unnamed protein product [Chironomus riparius]|uniref:C-type lectin domain-containing protein n=1 Tax=Chironomus riparius TaxID=315576 RepID=A0A9N9RW14_9DIPT|nr:unnamed protein product [Chironomus riparius]
MAGKLGTLLIAIILTLQILPKLVQCQNPATIPNNLQNTTEPTEYSSTFSTDLTEPVTPTTVILEESSCLKYFNYSQNSSACLVPIAKSFEEAHKICKSNDMKLLQIHSDKEKKTVFNVAREFFGSGGGTVLWIDGKWMYDKEEYRMFETNVTFYSSKKIGSPQKKFHGQDHYCLTIMSYFKDQYEISPIRCFNECYFFCQT